MKRKIVRGVLIVLFLIVAWFAISVVRHWDTIQRVFLGGVKVYETTPPPIPADLKRPAILVFSKTNAFRHEEAIPAANALFAKIAKDKGWGYFQTENGATFSPAILAKFDAVVFNNVSGDVFTPAQRDAFKAWLQDGGGYLGIHAAGDSSHEAWGWYMTDVIGATFTQHTMKPQFQEATVHLEDAKHPATQGLPSSWKHTEEWYSFDKSPRAKGYGVLVSVDEKTYNPEGMMGKDLRMGDHPMVWWHCSGKGRVLYSAFGHRAEAYAEPQNKALLTNAAVWAMDRGAAQCATAPAAGTAR
jgi:type 1 glutamine amidotransferase